MVCVNTKAGGIINVLAEIAVVGVLVGSSKRVGVQITATRGERLNAASLKVVSPRTYIQVELPDCSSTPTSPDQHKQAPSPHPSNSVVEVVGIALARAIPFSFLAFLSSPWRQLQHAWQRGTGSVPLLTWGSRRSNAQSVRLYNPPLRETNVDC